MQAARVTRAQALQRLAGRRAKRALPASLAAECAAAPDTPPARPPSEAAVLAPLIDRGAEMSVLLTRRADSLRSHPGQIGFPGGRVESGDRGPADTALREAEEEIGLPRARVEVLGCLDTCLTGTGYRVVPVVGVVAAPFALEDLTLAPAEVAEAFEIPLSFVLDARNHVRRTAVARGMRRSFYVLPYGERYIWGATARMLVNLCEILRTGS